MFVKIYMCIYLEDYYNVFTLRKVLKMVFKKRFVYFYDKIKKKKIYKKVDVKCLKRFDLHVSNTFGCVCFAVECVLVYLINYSVHKHIFLNVLANFNVHATTSLHSCTSINI